MATKLSNDKMKELAYLLEQRDLAECRIDFWKFCKYIDPAFFSEDKPHLKLIASKLQEVADGKIKKLAISLPPRAGKSYIMSMFCAWMLGKNPMGSIMRNSYAATLAEKFSKDIRDGILQKPKFRKIFPNVVLSKKSASVDAWSIEGNTQPSYFCAGVGGAITGFGCKTLAVLDDPIKNIEEALSETVIEGVWNWYTSTHLSRLETGCPEIHIATRWSKRDPIGRLTDPDSSYCVDDMEVITIPALVEVDGNTVLSSAGEGLLYSNSSMSEDEKRKADPRTSGKKLRSFCEAVKTTEEYFEIRRITDPFIWEAEFMQHPIEEKGLLYAPDSLHRFSMNEIKTKTPDGVIGFTDTADLGSDYLCSLIGYRFGEHTYITDVVFTQDGVEITEPLVADLIMRNNCQNMQIESNNGGRQFARNVKNILRDKKYQCSVTTETQTKNKETRILMQAGYVKEYFWFRNDYQAGSDYDKFFRQFTGYVKLGRNTHDDACFEAGTLVATISGDKPIEKIKIGDFVITPFGLKKVIWSGCTGHKKTISKFGLNATPNHKIFDGEFTELIKAKSYSALELKELIKWKYKKLLCSTGSNTDLWGRESIISANRKAMKDDDTLKDFMLQFGNFITKRQFLKAITFTTKTVILSITTLATWNAYQLANITKRTQRRLTRKLNNTLMKLDLLLLHGTKVQRAKNGTGNTESSVWQKESTFQKRVLAVVKSLNLNRQGLCTVPQNVLKKSGESVDVPKPVYNLNVADCHAYYANGILVSNCDAVTGMAEIVPYRHFDKPQAQKHYNFEFERKADEKSTYLGGEITDSYLDFLGGR